MMCINIGRHAICIACFLYFWALNIKFGNMKRCLLIFSIILSSLAVYSQAVEISSVKTQIDGKSYYLHTIKQGQTLYGISKAYGVSVEELTTVNPETSKGLKVGQIIKVPDTKTPQVTDKNNQQPAKIEGVEHIVQRGETVYGICRMYNLTVEKLYKSNPKIQEQGLKPGDILIIPESDVVENQPVQPPVDKPVEVQRDDSIAFSNHEVKRGETLYSIAKQYKVTESDILNANDGLNPSKLKTGQVIRIPREADPKTQFPKNDTTTQVTPPDNHVQESVPQQVDAIDYSPKSEMNIVVMLPFDIYTNTRNWYNQETAKKEFSTLPLNEMMLAYYSGCLMAFDSLKNNGLKVNVHVFDTGADTVLLSALLEKDVVVNADIIIGPVYTKQLKFIKDRISKKCILVSPFSDYEKVDMGATSVIWNNPGKIGRFYAISSYAALNPQQRYIIVYNNNDLARKEALELKDEMQRAAVAKNHGDSIYIAVISYSEASGTALSALMSQSTLNVVICNEKTEAQVSSLMSKLVQIKKTDICLLGELSWLDYRSIDAGYYNALGFAYTTPYWIDYTKPSVKNFVYRYRETFVAEPLSYSFAAYDQMLYLLDCYTKFGTDIKQYPHKPANSNTLATRFDFVNIEGSRQYIQKHCNILGFDEDFNTIQLFPVQ